MPVKTAPNKYQEPGLGDELVTVSMPRKVIKRALEAIVTDAHRTVKRGKSEREVENLIAASEALGDAIGAPPYKRFRRPDKMFYAVIAGDRAEYERWRTENYLGHSERYSGGEPLFIDSVETALAHVYYSHSQYGTAYRRDDFQEVIAAVRSRTFA